MTLFLDNQTMPKSDLLIDVGFDGIVIHNADIESEQYVDYMINSVQMIFVYDASRSGMEAGRDHAAKFAARLKKVGVSPGYPCAAAIRCNQPTQSVVDYQRGFYIGLRETGYFGPIGVCSDAETLRWMHEARPGPVADWYWNPDTLPHVSLPDYVNMIGLGGTHETVEPELEA